jgi:hypothetical protein
MIALKKGDRAVMLPLKHYFYSLSSGIPQMLTILPSAIAIFCPSGAIAIDSTYKKRDRLN